MMVETNTFYEPATQEKYSLSLCVLYRQIEQNETVTNDLNKTQKFHPTLKTMNVELWNWKLQRWSKNVTCTNLHLLKSNISLCVIH